MSDVINYLTVAFYELFYVIFSNFKLVDYELLITFNIYILYKTCDLIIKTKTHFVHDFQKINIFIILHWLFF